MRFAHLADCHIGAWRDPELRELPIRAFEAATTTILQRTVDFVLVAGDLFNTAVPPLDQVKRAVTQFQRLKQAGIPVYAIAGSHDYSPTGKTMLDVLEEAGLLVNVMKGEIAADAEGKALLKLRFTQDEKTGVKLTGILGRAGSLDRRYYEDLDRAPLEREAGLKIFLFHAPITELKTKGLEHMDSSSVSMMPKGFGYYAGGHVHIQNDVALPGYARVVYPGPLFPANFAELEELGTGGFVIVDTADGWTIERVRVPIAERRVVTLDASGKSAEALNAELHGLAAHDVAGTIVLLRAAGELADGRLADLRFKELVTAWLEKGALCVLKNTARLTSKEFVPIDVANVTADELERRVIAEHTGQIPLGLDAETEAALTSDLFAILGDAQRDGERRADYDERILRAANEALRR